MTDSNAGTLFRSMRPPFLVLTPACVLLGYATAYSAGAQVDPRHLLLVLAAALAAHASVNLFNEYFDFRSGLDAATVRTPFSGGSGALVEDPGAATAVMYAALMTLGITVLAGLYFVYRHGPALLPLGLAGVLIILTYTPWLNRHAWLCLVAPGTGFGPLMVVGTHFVLTGEYSQTAFAVSLVPFFLVNNLLLLNQYPDLQADRSVGRRHFPIRYGVRASTAVYGMFTAAACLVIVAGVMKGYLPATGYLALVAVCAAWVAFAGAWRHAADREKLVPYLGMNVLAAVLTPLLLAAALIIG